MSGDGPAEFRLEPLLRFGFAVIEGPGPALGTSIGLVTSDPPTPTRSPPCRAFRFAQAWRRFAPGFALRARAAAVVATPIRGR